MNRKFILKSLISVALIILILSRINLKDFGHVLLSARLVFLLISFVALLSQQWIIAYSWHIVLKAQRNVLPLRRVVQVHFIGNFFGTFLPTSIGMDIIRAYSLSKNLSKGVDAASSMFVLRVIGFLVLFGMALFVTTFWGQLIEDNKIVWTIVVASLTFVTAVGILFIPPARKLLDRVLTLLKVRSVTEKLQYFYQSILELSSDRSMLIKVILISFIMQVIGIFNFYLIGLSLNVSVPLVYYFLYLPIIQVIILIPISIAGIGIREGAFVYFFSQIGVTRPEALSLSLLVFAQAIAVALIGGLVYWTSGLSFKGKLLTKREVVN